MLSVVLTGSVPVASWTDQGPGTRDQGPGTRDQGPGSEHDSLTEARNNLLEVGGGSREAVLTVEVGEGGVMLLI